MAVSMAPTPNSRAQPACCSRGARRRSSKPTERSSVPMASRVTGRYSSPISWPHALGNAAMNSPMPRNSQNSLASRHGFSNASMRGRRLSVAKVLRQPTPISKPSSTTPASTSTNSAPMKASGIQKSGSYGLSPMARASDSIMMYPSCPATTPCHGHDAIAHDMPQQAHEPGDAQRVCRQQTEPARHQYRHRCLRQHLAVGYRARHGIGIGADEHMAEARQRDQPATEATRHQRATQPHRQQPGVAVVRVQAPPGQRGQHETQQQGKRSEPQRPKGEAPRGIHARKLIESAVSGGIAGEKGTPQLRPAPGPAITARGRITNAE